jgi:hypothetical protein
MPTRLGALRRDRLIPLSHRQLTTPAHHPEDDRSPLVERRVAPAELVLLDPEQRVLAAVEGYFDGVEG